MMLDLRALTDLPASVVLDVETIGLKLTDEVLQLEPTARVRLEVIRGDDLRYCRGRVICKCRLMCARCLENFDNLLDGEIEFAIRLEPASETEEALPDDYMIITVENEQVDITLPVREALLLEIPMKPLCREDCRGLCPQCGVNRNEQECDCQTMQTDPRWEGLQKLKEGKA